jgi:hypothetical protein
VNDKKWSASRLASKVDWEGGILATLDYGISDDEIEDPELAYLWGRLRDLYDPMAPLMDRVDAILRAAKKGV